MFVRVCYSRDVTAPKVASFRDVPAAHLAALKLKPDDAELPELVGKNILAALASARETVDMFHRNGLRAHFTMSSYPVHRRLRYVLGLVSGPHIPSYVHALDNIYFLANTGSVILDPGIDATIFGGRRSETSKRLRTRTRIKSNRKDMQT